MSEGKELQQIIDQTLQLSHGILDEYQPEIEAENIGSVHFVEKGVALVSGLSHVRSDELIRFAGNRLGIAFNLDPDEIGVILLDNSEDIDVSADVVRAGRVVDVPVGEELKGRIVDPIGRPLDEKGPLKTRKRRPVERPAPAIMDRLPVEVPLQTGIKAIDALIPIGRGQRELIIGDRQTGKTAIALDTIINQRDKNVLCIYCSIGQKNSDVVKFISKLRDNDALSYTIIVVGSGEDPPGLQYVAPYAAMSIGEYFMERGEDVLVVFDDLTRHARVYRELSLLLRRPPAREAYPGDIFYIHSRLLERSTNVKEEKGGGSITALPIVETQAQNISAYIPTNLISITDGQIYLSPELHRKGILPAIDIGKSVSRVGGKTQLPAYRGIAGNLRLSYSQFEELESFARFSSRLDEETRMKLMRGRRVREILKQPQYEPIPVPEQIAVLLSVTEGILDDFEPEEMTDLTGQIRSTMRKQLPDISRDIEDGKKLDDESREKIVNTLREVLDLDEKQ